MDLSIIKTQIQIIKSGLTTTARKVGKTHTSEFVNKINILLANKNELNEKEKKLFFHFLDAYMLDVLIFFSGMPEMILRLEPLISLQCSDEAKNYRNLLANQNLTFDKINILEVLSETFRTAHLVNRIQQLNEAFNQYKYYLFEDLGFFWRRIFSFFTTFIRKKFENIYVATAKEVAAYSFIIDHISTLYFANPNVSLDKVIEVSNLSQYVESSKIAILDKLGYITFPKEKKEFIVAQFNAAKVTIIRPTTPSGDSQSTFLKPLLSQPTRVTSPVLKTNQETKKSNNEEIKKILKELTTLITNINQICNSEHMIKTSLFYNTWKHHGYDITTLDPREIRILKTEQYDPNISESFRQLQKEVSNSSSKELKDKVNNLYNAIIKRDTFLKNNQQYFPKDNAEKQASGNSNTEGSVMENAEAQYFTEMLGIGSSAFAGSALR